MLGLPMRERADFVPRDPKPLTPPSRVHRGWSWACGCVSFAREENDRYLYVPCVAHTAVTLPGGRRASEPSGKGSRNGAGG